MEPHGAFNDLDYAVIGTVFLSGILALMRGFTRELFSLLAWVGAYFIASKFYAPAIPWAHHYIKSEKIAEWAAIAGVFAVALIVLSIIGHFMCGFIKGRALTFIDRSLGFAYGVARGSLVICLLYLCAVVVLWPDIDSYDPDESQEKNEQAPPALLINARTRPLMAYGAEVVKSIVPKEIIDKTLQGAEEKKKEAEEAAKRKALDVIEQTGND